MKSKTLFSFALFAAALLAITLSGGSASAVAAAVEAPAPLRILLVVGGCCHDYVRQPQVLKKGLEERANVIVDIVSSENNGVSTTHAMYNTADWAKGYDLVIHDECSADIVDLTYIANVLKPHADGLPAVLLHCAMHNYRTPGWNTGAVTPWFELSGLQSSGHGAQLPIALNFIDRQNEITKDFANWSTGPEELYNNYAGGVLPTAKPLVLGKQGADETVVVWTNIYKQKARVFASTLGHNNATVEDPRYLDLVTRGVLWAANKLNSNYLKPVPAVAPQKQAQMSAPAADRESVEFESANCGCQDTADSLVLAD